MARKRRVRPMSLEQFMNEPGSFGITSVPHTRPSTLGARVGSKIAKDLSLRDVESTNGASDEEATVLVSRATLPCHETLQDNGGASPDDALPKSDEALDSKQQQGHSPDHKIVQENPGTSSEQDAVLLSRPDQVHKPKHDSEDIWRASGVWGAGRPSILDQVQKPEHDIEDPWRIEDSWRTSPVWGGRAPPTLPHVAIPKAGKAPDSNQEQNLILDHEAINKNEESLPDVALHKLDETQVLIEEGAHDPTREAIHEDQGNLAESPSTLKGSPSPKSATSGIFDLESVSELSLQEERDPPLPELTEAGSVHIPRESAPKCGLVPYKRSIGQFYRALFETPIKSESNPTLKPVWGPSHNGHNQQPNDQYGLGVPDPPSDDFPTHAPYLPATGLDRLHMSKAALKRLRTSQEAFHRQLEHDCVLASMGTDKTCMPSNSGHNAALTSQNANQSPTENIRPAPQNLRYGAYQGQPAPQSRTTPLGSGRLQNASKSGSGSSWGFGAPNGVSALPAAQPRPTATGANSFAQTIGGAQPAASLDLSEFPSLSGTSQPQYQNASQAIWANQRTMQQTPVQRPQQHPIASVAAQQSQQSQQTQDQSHRNNDDMFSASSHLQSAMDDPRFGGTGTLGQLPASRQPQMTNVDDFPPLGRNGTDETDDRRGVMPQSAGFGAFSGANAFSLPSDQVQARNPLPSASSSQANNTRSSSVVDRLTSPNGVGFAASSNGRSPIEPNRQSNIGQQDQERISSSTNHGNQRDSNMNSLLNNFVDSQFPPQRQTSQPQQQDYVSRTGDAVGSSISPDRSTPSQMSAMDEFGLSGFLATARSENPDVSGLARGQDLTSLGLNLNSPEPLYPTFGGPFADMGSRSLQPDYKLPECYVVDNVHRVRDKVPGFIDETLFWIFYNQPRDILQELAATELERTNRNWRFHKDLRMWLTKDTTLSEPIQLSAEKEQGSYLFFNPQQWEKVRVTAFELHYQQLAPTSSRPNL